jgi:homoserine kinase
VNTPARVPHWLLELDGRRIRVEVPATSANLGAGYDCIALALELVDQVEVEVRSWSRGEVDLTITGEGADELPADRTNRFIRGLEAALATARGGEELPPTAGWTVTMANQIPLERGLGSSAAATVAGLVCGNALVGERLTSADLLRLASEIEGHPDNVAAALLGGFVVSAPLDDARGGVEAIRFDVPRDLRAVLFVPELRLETRAMRAVLPAKVPMADAVTNLGRVAIGVAGLATGRHDLLRLLTRDRLHERYRAEAYPQLPALLRAATDGGAIGACLSGAGSTVIAFADTVKGLTRVEAAIAAAAADADLPGRLHIVSPRNAGTKILSRG